MLLAFVVLIPLCVSAGNWQIAQATDDADSMVNIILGPNTDPTRPLNPNDPNGPTDTIIDSEDSGNHGTQNKGPLSIDYVPNLNFGIQKIQAKDAIYSVKNKVPFIQVTDTSGSFNGWYVTVSTTGFKNVAGTEVLKGAELIFQNGKIISATGNVSTAPRHQNIILTNAADQVIMVADKGAGKGTWLNSFAQDATPNNNIQLKVPKGSAKPNIKYNATLDWKLMDAPR